MDIAITKISSKGQVVIPSEMRKGLHKGDKLVIIKSNKQLILKKAIDLEKNMEEDLKFAKRTEEAWKKYQRGEFKSLPVEKFLQELDRC